LNFTTFTYFYFKVQILSYFILGSTEAKKERRHTNHRFHAGANNAASGSPNTQMTTENYFE
jgi:hypothetical protein